MTTLVDLRSDTVTRPTDAMRAAMLAAGALLTPGKRIASGELWSGRPAAKMRDLPAPAIADMQLGVAHYVENGKRHFAAVEAHAQGEE